MLEAVIGFWTFKIHILQKWVQANVPLAFFVLWCSLRPLAPLVHQQLAIKPTVGQTLSKLARDRMFKRYLERLGTYLVCRSLVKSEAEMLILLMPRKNPSLRESFLCFTVPAAWFYSEAGGPRGGRWHDLDGGRWENAKTSGEEPYRESC